MSKYDSTTKNKKQARFAQEKPLAYCRNSRQNLILCRELVETGRINYIFSCRRVRCSLECNAACKNKHASCVNKFVRDYVRMPTYRGHLRLPVDATPDDHKRCKKKFLRIMARWRKTTGHAFEVHAVQHITDMNNCHWDTVAYSDAPRKTLRAVVSSAWERAGGLRQSLVPLEPDEVESQCRYQAKDVAPERIKGKRYLPCAGLQFHWSSNGFWQGHKRDDLWKELILEWFPKRESSNLRDTLLEPTEGVESPALSPVQEAIKGRLAAVEDGSKSVSLRFDDSPAAVAERTRVLAEIDKRLAALPGRNAVNIMGQLPAVQGVNPASIADDTGLPEPHVRHLLKTKCADRGAAAPPIRLPGGGWRFDSWYMEPNQDDGMGRDRVGRG